MVDELSGGQFVLVNEAVNLGIAIYNMRQGEGIGYETLFRDEMVGALDAVNGKEYVRMLRRTMNLGGLWVMGESPMILTVFVHGRIEARVG